jgi:hypothetical protein
MGRRGMDIGFCLEARRKNLDIGGRIILKWILER